MIRNIARFIGKDGKVDQKAMRREVSKLSSMANKRIERLEKANLQNSPAYQKWVSEGSERFGVAGKTYNEVQSELARVQSFIDSRTSTIKGINQNLKDIAANTGIKYSSVAELHKKSEKFFELSSKVEQYLRSVEDAASAIGYQKIWEAINQYVETTGQDLADEDAQIDSMVSIISDALIEVDKGDEGELDDFWFILQ